MALRIYDMTLGQFAGIPVATTGFTTPPRDGTEAYAQLVAYADSNGVQADLATEATQLTIAADIAALLAEAQSTDPVTVVGIITNPSANFTRPNDTNAYASGDLVANSTTAGSVVPMSLTAARANGGNLMVRRVKLKKSGTSTSNASFRVHLFTVIPTIATTGDNGVFATVVTGATGWVAAFDVTIGIALADGAVGNGAIVSGAGSELNVVCAGGSTTLYALIEARPAYTPTAQEVFTVTLEELQN